MLLVPYQKKNSSGKTVQEYGRIVVGWAGTYSSLDSALLRPKSANSPSDAMPPPASEE